LEDRRETHTEKKSINQSCTTHVQTHTHTQEKLNTTRPPTHAASPSVHQFEKIQSHFLTFSTPLTQKPKLCVRPDITRPTSCAVRILSTSLRWTSHCDALGNCFFLKNESLINNEVQCGFFFYHFTFPKSVRGIESSSIKSMRQWVV
jgi:hypothetical protein